MYKSEYRKEFGDYTFYENDRLQFCAHSVAIAGTKQEDGLVIMRKHGPPDKVREWVKKERQKLRESGLDEWADGLFVVESEQWPLKELNMCVHSKSYLQVLLDKIEGE